MLRWCRFFFPAYGTTRSFGYTYILLWISPGGGGQVSPGGGGHVIIHSRHASLHQISQVSQLFARARMLRRSRATLARLLACRAAWGACHRSRARTRPAIAMLSPCIANARVCGGAQQKCLHNCAQDGEKLNAGSLAHHPVRSVHACWLARAIRVPVRACVRERAAGLRCGGLASHRVLGEPEGLTHHGSHKKGFFWST